MNVSDSVRGEVDELLTRLTKTEQHDLLEALRRRHKEKQDELHHAMLGSTTVDLLAALREAVEIIEGTGLDATTQREAIQRATGAA